jgi:hypothetical protein
VKLYQNIDYRTAEMAFNLLPGKIVAVTGCSTGIGRAIAIGKSPFKADLDGQYSYGKPLKSS